MGKIAFIFPGQGSQKAGMGRSFAENFPLATNLFQKANELLGFDLRELCFSGDDETLRQTENAQPALLTTSIIALRCFQSICSIKADGAAGHSVGEYAALVAADVLSFEDALLLVRKRAELMRDAAIRMPGSMAAILGIDPEAARQICSDVKAEGAGIVSVANYNGGGQIVISGEIAAVEKAGCLAKERGAKRVIALPVSGGFHSPLMVTAGDALYEHLNRTTFRKPKIPVVANVSAQYVEMPDDLLGGLTMQVSRSVRWEESMQLLLSDGYDTFLEFGSGEVLAGLMRRIDKTAKTMSVFDAESLHKTCEALSI